MAFLSRYRYALVAFIAAALLILTPVIVVRTYRVLRLPMPPLLPAGELRVGIDPSFPPFASSAGQDFRGIDVDIAIELAERMNVPLRFVTLGYDGLYDALSTNQIDVLLAAIVIDPARRDRVLYSRPYFNAGLVLVSNETNAVSNMEDFSGLRLAFELGSLAHSEAERWLRRIPPFALRPYVSADDALAAVQVGDADAAITDHVSARLYLQMHTDWNAALSEVTVTPLAAATSVQNGALAARIDELLEVMEADGTLNGILERWL